MAVKPTSLCKLYVGLKITYTHENCSIVRRRTADGVSNGRWNILCWVPNRRVAYGFSSSPLYIRHFHKQCRILVVVVVTVTTDHITLLWAIFVFVVVHRPKEDNDSSNKECQFGRHGLCACCDLRTAVHVDQKSNATCFFSISVLKNISDLLVLETTDPNSQARYICRFILVHDWKGFEQSWKMEIVRFAYHFRFGSQNSPHGYQFENTEQCI